MRRRKKKKKSPEDDDDDDDESGGVGGGGSVGVMSPQQPQQPLQQHLQQTPTGVPTVQYVATSNGGVAATALTPMGAAAVAGRTSIVYGVATDGSGATTPANIVYGVAADPSQTGIFLQS